jgi:hypothetical protein
MHAIRTFHYNFIVFEKKMRGIAFAPPLVFNDAVNSSYYTASMTDTFKYRWNDPAKGKKQVLEKTLSQYPTVHHKSHTDRP